MSALFRSEQFKTSGDDAMAMMNDDGPSILEVPKENLCIILSFLDTVSIGRCELTCRKFNEAGKESSSWSTLDALAASDLKWNECGYYYYVSNDVSLTATDIDESSSGLKPPPHKKKKVDSNLKDDQAHIRCCPERYRSIRYYKAMKVTEDIESLIGAHFGPLMRPDGMHISPNYVCSGCKFPDKLHLDWMHHPEDYEYFVRIATCPRGLPPQKTFQFQGFFKHSSVTWHTHYVSPPTRQLNIDLRDSDGSKLPYFGPALGCVEQSNGTLGNPRVQVGLVTIVLAVRKRDLDVGIILASNKYCGHCISSPSSFQWMSQRILPENTHGTYSGRDARIFGELSFHLESCYENQHTGAGPWQMRVVCGTFEQTLYTPDREALKDFYQTMN